MKKRNLFGYFFLLFTVFVFPKIHEKIEVIGKLYTSKLQSKNIVVITDREIELMKSDSVSEVLRNFTSVNISGKGGSGELFDITMRGGNFEQVLLLINGVPFNNSQTGHFNSDFPFQVKDIDRIEIIKGGTSIGYGSGAYSGVINIILKKKPKLGVSIEGGNNNYMSARLDIGKTLGKFKIKFGASKKKSDGFYKGREFDISNLTSNISYSDDGFEADSFFGYKKNDFGAAGFYAPFPSLENIGSFFWQMNIKKRIGKNNYYLRYSFDSHNDEFILDRNNPDYYQNESKTLSRKLSFSSNYQIGKVQLNTGLNLKRDVMDSLSMNYHKRDSLSAFINFNIPLNGIGVDFGLRTSIFEDNDLLTNYYLGLYSDLTDNFKFKINLGTSFRLPSFTELYYNSPSNRGNPNLLIESSDNYEASVLFLAGKNSLEVNVFYRKQSESIDWVKFKDDDGRLSPYWQAVNIEKNDLFGLEFIHNIAFEDIIFNYGIEKIFSNDSNYEFLSKYGLRYPDFTVKLNLSFPVTTWLRLVANYNYKTINNTELDGHFLNILTSIKIDNLTVTVRINNIFNKVIEEIPGVKIPGRWAYIELSYNLN